MWGGEVVEVVVVGIDISSEGAMVRIIMYRKLGGAPWIRSNS